MWHNSVAVVVNSYYSDAECRWVLVVQPLQTIRITLYDFELDIKRAGVCKDYVEISSSDQRSRTFDVDRSASASSKSVFFRDCGALGRHTVDVPTNVAVVRFVVDQSSLTQRGFFLYFQGNRFHIQLPLFPLSVASLLALRSAIMAIKLHNSI